MKTDRSLIILASDKLFMELNGLSLRLPRETRRRSLFTQPPEVIRTSIIEATQGTESNYKKGRCATIAKHPCLHQRLLGEVAAPARYFQTLDMVIMMVYAVWMGLLEGFRPPIMAFSEVSMLT